MSGYIRIDYDNDLHKRALAFSEDSRNDHGKLNFQSVRSDTGGRYIGFVSEQVVADTLGWKKVESLDFDLMTPSDQKVEVKCREYNVDKIPKLDYGAGIYTYFEQKCDFFCFTRVNPLYRTCWILGLIKPAEFYEKSVFLKEGSIDPSNNWKVRRDTYNIELRDLKWPKSFKDKIKPYKK